MPAESLGVIFIPRSYYVSKWRERALELFPGMRLDIEKADSIGLLWVKLSAYYDAYYWKITQGDVNESSKLIAAIYEYAIWCSHSQSSDTFDAATLGFYEHVSSYAFCSETSIYDRIVKDLVSNLGLSEIKRMSWAFAAMIEPHQFEDFMMDCERIQRQLRCSAP